MYPPVPRPPLGRERRWDRGNYKDLHNRPKAPGPRWLCLVKSLVKYSSQGTAGTTPGRLQKGPSISARGLRVQRTRSGLYAWARGRTTFRMNYFVDEVIRRGPKEVACLPLCSHEGTHTCQFRP